MARSHTNCNIYFTESHCRATIINFHRSQTHAHAHQLLMNIFDEIIIISCTGLNYFFIFVFVSFLIFLIFNYISWTVDFECDKKKNLLSYCFKIIIIHLKRKLKISVNDLIRNVTFLPIHTLFHIYLMHELTHGQCLCEPFYSVRKLYDFI